MILKRLLLIAGFLLCAAPAYAACTGSSPNWSATADETSILACIASATNGDTITVANGTANITGQWHITTSITLQAATPCTTADGVVATGVATSTCGTTINNTITSGTKAILITLHGGAGAVGASTITTRLTGFKFTGAASSTYLIQAEGCMSDNRRVRIDHNYFSSIPATVLADMSTALGTVDHNYFKEPVAGQQVFVGFTKDNGWGTCGSNTFGDGSWAVNPDYGTGSFTFYEDNIMDGCAYTSNDVTGMDGLDGGRAVIRYNDILCTSLEAHGLEDTRDRSFRAVEIYNNYMCGSGLRTQVIYWRGGSGRVHDNTICGWGAATFNLLNNRVLGPNANPFGGSSGVNQWDTNSGSNPIKTGTSTAGAGALVLTDSGATFGGANAQQNRAIRKTGGIAIPNGGCTRSSSTVTCNTTGAHGFSTDDVVSIVGATEYVYQNNIFGPITVIDSDTFTFNDVNSADPTLTGASAKVMKGSSFSIIDSSDGTHVTAAASVFAALGTKYNIQFAAGGGDTYEINEVSYSFDQPGRGSTTGTTTNLNGDLIPTYPGSNTQVVEAWYEWNNTREAGADVDFTNGRSGGAFSTIVENVHYFNDTTLNSGTTPSYTPYTYPFPWSGCTPDHLTFSAQPSNALVGAVLGTVSVGVYDSGNVLCTDSTGVYTITIANKGGTCTGMTLGGTASGTETAGVFTTTNLTENAAGSCTLSVTSSPSLTGADSGAFTISSTVGVGADRGRVHR